MIDLCYWPTPHGREVSTLLQEYELGYHKSIELARFGQTAQHVCQTPTQPP